MSPALRLFLRRNRRHVGELLLASAVVNAFLLSLPLFSMLVYDKAMGNDVHDTLYALAGGMALLFGLEIALRIGRVILVEHAGVRWDTHLDERLMRGILATPVSKPLPVGEVVSRYREVASTRDFLSAQFLLPITDLPYALLFIGAIVLIGGVLVLVPLVIGVLLVSATSLLQWQGMRRQRVASAAQASKLTWLVDVLAARDSLMSKPAAAVAAARYRAPALTGARAAAQSRLWSQTAQVLVPIAMSASTVALLVVGVFRVEAHELSVGGLVSCNLLGGRLLGLMCSAAPVVLRWKEFAKAVQGLAATVDVDVAPVGSLPAASDAFDVAGLRLDQVDFQYPQQQRKVLDGLSLELRTGELVAVVGASGAGKSTLLRLLAGHVPHTAGRLAYAGHVISADAERRWLCSQVAYKPQDPSFLRGTLAEIVAPGVAEPSDAALVAALRASGFGPVLDRGDLGLTSEVGTNGTGLSGGQRQMLALARALYQPPEGTAEAAPQLLLLDEPTLGLDRPAQEQVLRGLAGLKTGRCVVIATHATEVIQCVDRVLVLERGRIVADAPPGRLLGAHVAPPPRPARASPAVAAGVPA